MEDEVQQILMSGDRYGGDRLNDLVDEFREGRDVGDLFPLLGSEDAEVVSTAAWMLSELQPDLYSVEQVISRLWELAEHRDPMVRFNAFSALAPFLSASDPATHGLLVRLAKDENDGVRMLAEAARRKTLGA